MSVQRFTIVRERQLKVFSKWCAAASIVIGAGVLIAWLISYIPGAHQMSPSAMNPVAAVLFVLLGIGFQRSNGTEGHGPLNKDRVAIWLAAAIIGVALFKLLEFLTFSEPWIDQLLFAAKARPHDGMAANVLAPNTVLNFLLCGTALLCLDYQSKRGYHPHEWLVVLAAVISMLALVGYSYQVMALYKVGAFAPMAWLTAVAFMLVCASALTCRPARGAMGLINSQTMGGAVARRLLPMAIIIPWMLGVLRWAGEWKGLYRSEVGVALFTVVTMLVFSVIVWWTARLLHRADAKRRVVEKRLREATANLERSNSELQQFAYVASHDLFEPLRMIRGYLDLLEQTQKAKLDGQGIEFIGYAKDGAQRMTSLIKDLLAYSRVDSGVRAFQIVNCNTAAAAAIANLKVAIEESGAVVEVGELPKVRGDPVQLTQLFQNLFANAVKFRGAESPRIRTVAHAGEHEWTFSVSDNGIGIDPAHFDRIFVIFQRLHTRKEYPGTGMGLAICKKIVERHGGRIWVESTRGKGSTFYFTIPEEDAPRRRTAGSVRASAAAQVQKG